MTPMVFQCPSLMTCCVLRKDGLHNVCVVCLHLTYSRLFLTMDPNYGELSHAMRNRGIELYIPPSNVQTHTVRGSAFSRVYINYIHYFVSTYAIYKILLSQLLYVCM